MMAPLSAMAEDGFDPNLATAIGLCHATVTAPQAATAPPGGLYQGATSLSERVP